MQIDGEVIIKLTLKEAVTLRKFLGTQSKNDYKESGMNSSGADMMSEFFKELNELTGEK